jgi:hypothetical protein
MNWKLWLKKAQRTYDKKWIALKRISNLRQKAYEVRRQLQAKGIDQKPLLRGKNALQVEGVIYVIWCSKSHLMYVGQTLNSAFHRFKQHKWKANSIGSTPPICKLFRRHKLSDIYIFPLEMISRKFMEHNNPKDRKAHFRKLATVRENYWIERLLTYMPRGYNIAYGVRNRHRPHRRNNQCAII